MKLFIHKKYHEYNLIELYIKVKNEFIELNQTCYIEDEDLKKNSESILKFLNNEEKECLVIFGKISKDYTPAFSINFLKEDQLGHIRMEFNCEICDDVNRNHRAECFIYSEIGIIENMAKCLNSFTDLNYDKDIIF